MNDSWGNMFDVGEIIPVGRAVAGGARIEKIGGSATSGGYPLCPINRAS